MATPSKKMVNAVASCVDDSLRGLVYLNPNLKLMKDCPRIVLRADIEDYKKSGRVTVLTGGGSGHEPLFPGYIGAGMMSAAVQGDLFASPGPRAILSGLRAVGANHPAGVLVIFNNYTGDRLNFGIAIEKAKSEGIRVETVVVGDDCAVMTRDKSAGRRGLAGNVFIMKIVGALAEQGIPLDDIVDQAKFAMQGLGTLGVCLAPCSLPGRPPLFHIDDDKMEVGLGLHGEAGVKSETMKPAKETVELIINYMLDPQNPSHLKTQKTGNMTSGDAFAVLINNLGSTSDLEINIIVKETMEYLGHLGMTVTQAFAGRYATSQEMAGFSISLLEINPKITELLNFDTSAPNWHRPLYQQGQSLTEINPFIDVVHETGLSSSHTETEVASLSQDVADMLRESVKSACVALISAEDYLNQLDSGSGDGDCGSTLAAGARVILNRATSDDSTEMLLWLRPYYLFNALSEMLEGAIGGCSGALYCLLFTSIASGLRFDVSVEAWVASLQAGLQSIMIYGRAEPGDRTMVDPLNAALLVLKKSPKPPGLEAFREAVEASRREAEATRTMMAGAGRASYVSQERLTEPDAGAVAIAIWMTALVNTFNRFYK